MPAPQPDVLDRRAVQRAFARELADVNRRRLRVIGPIMVAVHLAHIWIFWVSAAQRYTLAEDVVRTRHDLMLVHAAMVPLTGLLTVLVYRAPQAWIGRLMGPVVTALYLAHGALCTAFDLIVAQSVTTYVSYCLGMAVIVCLTPRAALIAYGLGLATFVGALAVIAPAALGGLSTMPTCVTITVVGGALACALYAARRREFQQRQTIERQRDQLTQLNSALGHRVDDQVGEIVARATEVEQLNAQLQAQVRARSGELSLALARLAQQRRGDDAVLRGTVLGGRFTVGALIGEGGMGAVYDGLDRATGARVAIKIVQATSSRTLDALRRFAREAGTAAAVNHPAVVRMIDVDISDDGLLFQVQELIDGTTLARRIGRPWRARDAARLGAVLCDALAAAHAVGVVHRDVKPDNVMLTLGAPGLKLLDFGIAKLYAAVHGHDDDAMTRTGIVIGTPAYMAPEQVLGETGVTDRADVYATGVILFRLVSERAPFEAESPREVMTRRLLDPAPDVRAFAPAVPAALAQLIARCLARQADARPTAAELARALATWADTAGAPALERIARDAVDAGPTAPAIERHDLPTAS